MNGQLYIDGVDAYTAYRCVVLEGGFNTLIAMPPLKAVKFNDWQENDGIDADLTAPVLGGKECTVKFAFKGEASYNYFIDKFAGHGYHTFYFARIQREYRLRLVGHSSYETHSTLVFATLKFADDFPLLGYTYREPVGGVPRDEEYTLGARPLSDYGIRVLDGTLSELLRTADVKPNMTRDIATRDGVIYDTGIVRFKSKDVSLRLLFRADSISALWCNYDAFLYDLSKPDERVLSVKSIGHDFIGYYKSCAVTEFYSGACWLRCTITMTLTRGVEVRVPAMRLVTPTQMRLTQDYNLLINKKSHVQD